MTRDGFHELQLPLQKFTSGNETTNGEAAGALAGISVGYTFEIRKSDKGEFAIRFHFSGELGENLIIALKAQLGVRTDSNRPQPSHLFEANGIADGPRLRSGLPAHFELINLHDEPNYGEWYFKLDESQRCVTLAEKNEAYREMLVRTLIGKGTD